MAPTIGRIVIYHTNETDRKEMRDRGDNVVSDLPAIVVNVWSDSLVNLQVIADGEINLWRTSINLGPAEGYWEWPQINK